MHDVGIGVCKDASGTPLTTNTALLVAAEESIGQWLLEAVDPDAASFKPAANLFCLFYVSTPHACAQAGI